MEKYEREQAVAQVALSVMAQHEVAPTPPNFELFFAYAASEPPAIARLIGEMIAKAERFTPDMLERLHKRASTTARTHDVVDSIGTDISSTLNSMLVLLETASKDTVAFGQVLSVANGELDGQQSPDGLRSLVGKLKSATQTMEIRSKVLEDELQKSSIEVAELKTKLDDVRKESLTDPLTGIPNRKSFDQEMHNAIANAGATGEALSLLMCDIDHFKMFNDTWGHQTGDQVLRLVASCLSDNVKGRDTAARYGGEEFAVILRQTQLKFAVKLANQIRENVQNKKLVRKSTGDILGTITISIGVAQLRPGESIADLIHRADACLYAAKHAGRNRVLGEDDAVTIAAA